MGIASMEARLWAICVGFYAIWGPTIDNVYTCHAWDLY